MAKADQWHFALTVSFRAKLSTAVAVEIEASKKDFHYAVSCMHALKNRELHKHEHGHEPTPIASSTLGSPCLLLISRRLGASARDRSLWSPRPGKSVACRQSPPKPGTAPSRITVACELILRPTVGSKKIEQLCSHLGSIWRWRVDAGACASGLLGAVSGRIHYHEEGTALLWRVSALEFAFFLGSLQLSVSFSSSFDGALLENPWFRT